MDGLWRECLEDSRTPASYCARGLQIPVHPWTLEMSMESKGTGLFLGGIEVKVGAAKRGGVSLLGGVASARSALGL